MATKKCCLALAITLPALLVCGGAFGWSPVNTHPSLCQVTFDNPIFASYLSGVDQSAIENYSLEPTDACHSAMWPSMVQRSYIDTAGPCSTGYNWNSLDETTRLKYLQHATTDVCVPVNHTPNGSIYTNTFAEGLLEAQVATWTDYGSVANTCNYTHTRNGHSYSLTGTIDQVVSTFLTASRDNTTWFKSTKQWWGGHNASDNSSAGWNATRLGLMLQRAVFMDYFLAKETPVIVADDYFGVSGGSILFNQSDSYDPDAISWNSNGTYSQIYGAHEQGIEVFVWDFDMDLEYDYGSYTPYLDITVDELIAHGCPTNQSFEYICLALDNEGKTAYDVGNLYLSAGDGLGMMIDGISTVPEPATMVLVAAGAVAMLKRRRKS